MSYYFLVASLPSFTLDDPPGLSEDAFMDRCRDQLSPRDWAAMQAVMAPAPRADPHPFAEAWYRVETALRNALVRVRAERRKADAAAYLRENAAYGAEASRAVADAFGRKTPLERERALDRFRWEQAEQLAGFDPFATRAVLAYGVRLKLARRWVTIEREKGEEQAEALIKQKPRTASGRTAENQT